MGNTDTDVVVLAQDTGPAENLVEVVPHLTKAGLVVKSFLAPNAAAVFAAKGLEFTPYESANQVIALCPKPRVLYVGLDSAEENPGLCVARALREKSWGGIIIGQEDWWGAGLKYWRYGPLLSVVMVGDETGRKLATEILPYLNIEDVLVTGWPSFDPLISYDTQAARRAVKEQLGIDNDWPIVFFPGQMEGTGDTFIALVDALNRIDEVNLIYRLHPRMRHGHPEWQKIQQGLGRLQGGLQFDTTKDISQDPPVDPYDVVALTAAADAVVGMFTTLLNKKSAMGGVAIAYLPKFVLDILNKETEGQPATLPLAAAGCCAFATDPTSLAQQLNEAFFGNLAKSMRSAHYGIASQRTAFAITALTGCVK